VSTEHLERPEYPPVVVMVSGKYMSCIKRRI